MSTVMRWEPTAPPKIQPCCGKQHPLPFQHIRTFQDKRGRTRHVNECASCFKTRHQDGHAIRWTKRGDPFCAECAKAMDARLEQIAIHTADPQPLRQMEPSR